MISHKQQNSHKDRHSQSQQSETQRMCQYVEISLNKNKMVSSMKTIKSDESFPGPQPNVDIKKVKFTNKQSNFQRTDSIMEIEVNKRNQSNQSFSNIQNRKQNKVYYNLDSVPIPLDKSFYVPTLQHNQNQEAMQQQHQYYKNIALVLFVIFVIVALISQKQLIQVLKLISNLGILWYTILIGILQIIWEYLL